MKKILDLITEEMEQAFADAGYEKELARVTLSNRPDLCEYQCNGAMAGAKKYHKAPIMIAEEVVAKIPENGYISGAEAVKPGFINLKTNPAAVADYLNQMEADEKLGAEEVENPKTIVIDYGGPNVAKPLHVGHLRSAIIGESVKRITRFMGNKVVGDIHLGDWGYQMGLIITEQKKRQPDLPYFDDNFTGEYPKEAPFTISDLEEIYPAASAYAKEHDDYREEALDATFQLQSGKRGYRAIWDHIMNVSVTDLKKNYANLNVEFDLWKGESDAQKYIPDMVERLKKEGYAHIDNGALVVDVKEETDTKEIPPCMILKSDGAALYDTTDLATLVEREELFQPNEVIYVVDKRQELHFVQVFRCAKKTGIVKEDTKLTFLGFGTMNGKDGKPFKTREGGVMRLENLIADIDEAAYNRIMENRTVSEDEAKTTAEIVGLAALKYGDLSNQATKDYVFDIDRFTSFEGNTGPYVLYTIARINSILKKCSDTCENTENGEILPPSAEPEKTLMLALSRYSDVMLTCFEELAPHKICAYIYELSNALNHFYHETKIIAEEDKKKQAGYISLVTLTRDVLMTCINVLGFSAPERM